MKLIEMIEEQEKKIIESPIRRHVPKIIELAFFTALEEATVGMIRNAPGFLYRLASDLGNSLHSSLCTKLYDVGFEFFKNYTL